MVSSSAAGPQDDCGNGDIDAGEACDDENALDGDGCSTSCQLEGNPNTCQNGAVIELSDRIVIAGTTTNKNNFTSTICGGTSAPDLVYRVEPTKTAPIAMHLEANYNHIFAVRSGCMLFGSTSTTCDTDPSPSDFTFQSATVGTPFYIVISGSMGAAGDFTLEVKY
jgi:cysteine-rich repeat protein